MASAARRSARERGWAGASPPEAAGSETDDAVGAEASADPREEASEDFAPLRSVRTWVRPLSLGAEYWRNLGCFGRPAPSGPPPASARW